MNDDLVVATNDPACRRNNDLRHVCTDKFGAPWFRPGSGPRPGTTCFYETLMREEDAREQWRKTISAAVSAWAAEVELLVDGRIEQQVHDRAS